LLRAFEIVCGRELVMTALAKSILFGLLVVAAIVAVIFGLRRRHVPADVRRRGALAAVRNAFYAAVTLVLGGSTACVSSGPDESDAANADSHDADRVTDYGESSCYIPVDDAGREAAEDAWIPPEVGDDACYADTGLLDDAWIPPDADPPDADPQVDADDIPDGFDLDSVTCYQIGPDPDAGVSVDADPDAGVDGDDPDALVGLAPKERARRIRWARRTLERALAVRRILDDPGTHPAVRAALRSDLRRLSRHVRLARRFLGSSPGRRSPLA
jgi:hypothetical protein